MMFLGVDGGGTKTEFVLIDDEGAVLARAVTGTSYHLQVGLEEAERRLVQGVAAVCAKREVSPDAFDFVFFGLPAYGEDAEADPQLHAACGRVLGHDRYVCGNDMVCGWAGSLGCEDGVNIVAGTGSIGYGERAGRSARAGGWGEVFGDEGSAYWIAVQGLALFSRMADGRVAKGPLYDRVRTALSLSDDLDLCGRVMGQGGMGRDRIAGLATLVSQAAHDGDEGARAILAAAARELVELAVAMRRALGFATGEPVPMSWSGGVLRNEPLVRDAFVAGLLTQGFAIVDPRYEPGHGAALYARHLLRARSDA
jgi:N-acetylglucosamine kinase-like BadF-type ATPase